MRLTLLTTLTMIAFAANSVLNRMALATGGSDAGSVASLRLASGALMLAALVIWRQRGSLPDLRPHAPGRVLGVLSLLCYIYPFSAAYIGLDAGLGALILFGMVQITMFAGGVIAGEVMPPRRWAGVTLAFAGLGWLLWPVGGVQVSPLHGALMALAGVGWGLYSLGGRRAEDALASTAANFVLALPVGLALWGILSVTGALPAPMMNTRGAALAITSGAVTSGMGYALWYAVLPRLPASVAAVLQLTVPIIAMAGGLVLLGEVPSLPALMASGLVLGGVALSVLRPRRARA